MEVLDFSKVFISKIDANVLDYLNEVDMNNFIRRDRIKINESLFKKSTEDLKKEFDKTTDAKYKEVCNLISLKNKLIKDKRLHTKMCMIIAMTTSLEGDS